MINKFKKGVMRQYRIVKKFSTMIEARLSEEVLNLYHIRTVVIRNYTLAHDQLKDRMQEIYILVSPQDYQVAYRLLYS